MTLRSPSFRYLHRLVLALGLLLMAGAVAQAQDAERHVVVLPTSGVVDQVLAGYVREGIARAEAEGARAVVIELDTPGGSLDATRDIVQAQLSAEVPVIVWVGPAGSRAASAGTFLTLAGHIAAMAPATNIGAATPVNSDGSDIPDAMGEKVMEDTLAQIETMTRPWRRAPSTSRPPASRISSPRLTAGP
jgi:membrane-bound serine protease (ClpP class)